jgi:hypothetical protein
VGPRDAAAAQARNVCVRLEAAVRGSGEAMMADTTAMPCRVWPVGDAQPCSVRSRFVELIPPTETRASEPCVSPRYDMESGAEKKGNR